MVFKFKEFEVKQDKSAMKIGTDAVLLGAWLPIKETVNSILDIGAGTGVIALQMAQRSCAQLIDAIEIEDDAYEECVFNFENSPWADRLFCYHASLQEFVQEMKGKKYDLIVSNPPFYQDSFLQKDAKRELARNTNALSFKTLISSAVSLLEQIGTFAVIIPFKEESDFIDLAKEQKLFPFKITRVKGNDKSEIKRSLLAFSFNKKQLQVDELTIEIDRHKYTEKYNEIVKKFYLKM